MTFFQERYLVTCGLDQPNYTISVFDWARGTKITETRSGSSRMFDISVFKNSIVTAGVAHLKIWNLSGNVLESKSLNFGGMPKPKCMAVSVHTTKPFIYVTTLEGDIIIWKIKSTDTEKTPFQVLQKFHSKGGVFCSFCVKNDCLITAGKNESRIVLFEVLSSGEIQVQKEIDLSGSNFTHDRTSFCSYVFAENSMYLGSRDNSIFKIETLIPCRSKTVNSRKKLEETSATPSYTLIPVTTGHSNGELWGLSTCGNKITTASDDQSLRVWNLNPTEKNYTAVSTCWLKFPLRSCCFSPDGQLLAAGSKTGTFVIIKTVDLSELYQISHRKEALHDLKFSPDGNYLAVASNDNFVDIYDSTKKFKRVSVLKTGLSSFVTHLDWSKDSGFVRVDSGAGEHRVFPWSGGDYLVEKEELSKIEFSSGTSVLNPEVDFIWPKFGRRLDDINAVDCYGGLTATGDDFGKVKVFRRKKLVYEKSGHSAHVTNVRFTRNGQLVTTGGADHAVIVWGIDEIGENVKNFESGALSGYTSAESEVESEEEIIQKPPKTLKKQENSKSSRNVSKNIDQKSSDTINLHKVIGYRSHDSQHNIHYHENLITYPTAAIVIVFDQKTGEQFYYRHHDDDITCLTGNSDLIATGQVTSFKNSACVHIWNLKTRETLAIIENCGDRKIVKVSFCNEGRYLGVIGGDDYHCLNVYKVGF